MEQQQQSSCSQQLLLPIQQLTMSGHKHAVSVFVLRYFKIHFYVRKQLLLSARLSHCNSARLSVHLSHGWISQKQCKLESPDLHHRLSGRL